MENYEKKYKEIIEKLKKLQTDWKSTQNRAAKEIEDAIPELKPCESESEQIRKTLIEQINRITNPEYWMFKHIPRERFLEWLESKKEKEKENETDNVTQTHDENKFFCQSCKGFKETGKCFFDWDCSRKRNHNRKTIGWSDNDIQNFGYLIDVIEKSSGKFPITMTPSACIKFYNWLLEIRDMYDE